jgi:hypothetical protein
MFEGTGTSWAEEIAMLQPYFLNKKMDVIEAGCGRCWAEEFYSPLLSIVGIDSDEVALQIRTRRSCSSMFVVLKGRLRTL